MSEEKGLFSWFKRKSQAPKDLIDSTRSLSQTQDVNANASTLPPLGNVFQKIRRAASKLSSALHSLFAKPIDEDFFAQLETQLLLADVGPSLSKEFINSLRKSAKELPMPVDGKQLHASLKRLLYAQLEPYAQPLHPVYPGPIKKPFVILIVGINGSGKTTLIAKLAAYYRGMNKQVAIAAGDTFRAGATEQLSIWAKRIDVPIFSSTRIGQDPASVLFDALSKATALGSDILIADTAGRLQTQGGLMRELQKMTKVLKHIDSTAPHETMLVLDATLGQNSLQQAAEFKACVGLSGISLTKLDGTARGGAIFSVLEQLKLPIRFVSAGEMVEDVAPFDAEAFVDALTEQIQPIAEKKADTLSSSSS